VAPRRLSSASLRGIAAVFRTATEPQPRVSLPNDLAAASCRPPLLFGWLAALAPDVLPRGSVRSTQTIGLVERTSLVSRDKSRDEHDTEGHRGTRKHTSEMVAVSNSLARCAPPKAIAHGDPVTLRTGSGLTPASCLGGTPAAQVAVDERADRSYARNRSRCTSGVREVVRTSRQTSVGISIKARLRCSARLYSKIGSAGGTIFGRARGGADRRRRGRRRGHRPRRATRPLQRAARVLALQLRGAGAVCFVQSAQNFKTRYAMLGFSNKANLCGGAM
jgi:hypothetical protein